MLGAKERPGAVSVSAALRSEAWGQCRMGMGMRTGTGCGKAAWVGEGSA